MENTKAFRVSYTAPDSPETLRTTVIAKDAAEAQTRIEQRVPGAKVFHVQEV